MIKADRSRVPAPTIDKKRPSDGTTELERARAHMNDPNAVGSFEFSAYSSPAVKTALHALFHGKCAYCESFYASTQPVDVEHYRPKGEVEGVAEHPGYWWLAMEWTNLLPSCIDCNRRREQMAPNETAPSLMKLAEDADVNRWRKLSIGKASAFPLAQGSARASQELEDCDAELRLLLDPTRDDPDQHLGFYIDLTNLLSLVFPRAADPAASPVLPLPTNDAGDIAAGANAQGVSAVGAVSIQIYGLNRLALVQARTKLLRDLQFMLELSLSLAETEAEIDNRRENLEFERMGADAIRVATINDELAFLERIEQRFTASAVRNRAQLRNMLAPSAPYSAVARAWAKAYIDH
jgi:uncharacterized protein (TIGR02646 family)